MSLKYEPSWEMGGVDAPAGEKHRAMERPNRIVWLYRISNMPTASMKPAHVSSLWIKMIYLSERHGNLKSTKYLPAPNCQLRKKLEKIALSEGPPKTCMFATAGSTILAASGCSEG